MLDLGPAVRGRLEADFVSDGALTKARLLDAAPPLELRGPFAYGNVSSFYLRNVSCGVFAGDAYRVSLRACPGARAFVRGTAATKIHAMPSACATSHISIESSPGAMLAYYDGPAILQQGSDLTQRVDIVAGGGAAVYAEVLVFGRLARGETLDFQRYRSDVLVRGECDRVLYRERFDVLPSRDRASIADASLPVLGKVIAVGTARELPRGERELSGDGLIAGYDTLPSDAGLILRAAGERLEPVSRLIEAAVTALVHA